MSRLSRSIALLLGTVAVAACGGGEAAAVGGAGSTGPSGGSTSAGGSSGGTGGTSEHDAGTDPEAAAGDASAGSMVDCPPTFITRCGALLFADDFSSGDYKPEWVVVGGTWSVEDGKLVGSSPASEPDPNIGHMVAADRVVIRFSFSYSGTGEPGIRLNHKEAANPQHLLSVRLDQDPPSTAVLREMSGWSSTTKSTILDTEPTALVAATTYTAVLEVFDRNVTFSIDGHPIVSGMTVDQSAYPKNHMVLAAYGASVTYDDVAIWEGLPP